MRKLTLATVQMLGVFMTDCHEEDGVSSRLFRGQKVFVSERYREATVTLFLLDLVLDVESWNLLCRKYLIHADGQNFICTVLQQAKCIIRSEAKKGKKKFKKCKFFQEQMNLQTRSLKPFCFCALWITRLCSVTRLYRFI